MFQFIGSVFNTLVGRPVLNLLIIIIALIPGHNFGVAIIIFTIIIRLLLYPLLKKQLHHAMAMRKLQPEIKKVKKKAKGDKQKEYALMMELYKEREVKPMASIGILLAQLPILLALFYAINKSVNTPDKIVSDAYFWVQDLPFIEQLAANINDLNTNFLGINLTESVTNATTTYTMIGALVIVIGSVIVQYFQSKQLMMTDKNARSLKQILKDSGKGKEVDQTEVQAATSRLTLYIIPVFLFIVAINLASALSLYWLVGGVVALIQQTRILRKDVEEMEATVDSKPVKAEIVSTSSKPEKSEPEKKTHKKTGAKTYVKTASVSDDTPKKLQAKKQKNKKSGKRSLKKKKVRGQTMDESVIYAKKYLEDLLSFFGLNTEVHATTEEDVIELDVPSTHMNGFLIGQRGETIRSLQFMVSMALRSNGFEYTRVNVDIAGYKKNHHERLAEQAKEWMDKVKESGEPMHLRPMNPADRRTVHKVAGEYGLETASEGQGRDRHIVLSKTTE